MFAFDPKSMFAFDPKSMSTFDQKSMDAFTGPAREIFEAWISFFPTAPLFGVKWRFAPDFEPFSADMTFPAYTARTSTDTTII